MQDAFLAGFLGAAGGAAEGIGQAETGTAGPETLEDYYRKHVGDPIDGAGGDALVESPAESGIIEDILIYKSFGAKAWFQEPSAGKQLFKVKIWFD